MYRPIPLLPPRRHLALGMGLPLLASAGVPVVGTVDTSIRADGKIVQVELSAALGLFVGFPAVQRAHVRYTTSQGQGTAELNPGKPVVNFIICNADEGEPGTFKDPGGTP